MNIVKQVQLESPIFAINKAVQMGNHYPLAAKISACKAGTWHTIAYKGESKDVPGLVRYIKARLQLGRYENFAEVREARANGVGKKSFQSNDIFFTRTESFIMSSLKSSASNSFNAKFWKSSIFIIIFRLTKSKRAK